MSAAKRLERTDAYLESGVVERVGAQNAAIQVSLGSATVEARRAKSCLVAPEVGDTVLCASDANGVFVLAVLVGAQGAATKLTVEGDLNLQSSDGRVAICGADGVDIVSAGPITTTAPELSVRAKEASVAIDELGFFGKLVHANVSKVSLVAEEVDSVLSATAKRRNRRRRSELSAVAGAVTSAAGYV
jgi:hypothetical protein